MKLDKEYFKGLVDAKEQRQMAEKAKARAAKEKAEAMKKKK